MADHMGSTSGTPDAQRDAFTGGEWVVAEDRGNGLAIYAGAGKETLIAAVRFMGGTNREGEANAQVMATAPELLACLRDVLDADGDLDAMDFERYRAAIASAVRQ